MDQVQLSHAEPFGGDTCKLAQPAHGFREAVSSTHSLVQSDGCAESGQDAASNETADVPRQHGKRRNYNREPVRYWTEEEHRLFLIGVQKFGGRNYKALSDHIKTRTPTQVRTHLQKYLLKLQKAKRIKSEVNSSCEGQDEIAEKPCEQPGKTKPTGAPSPKPIPEKGKPENASPSSTTDVSTDPGSQADLSVDESALVEVFEEMANESRSNQGSQGLNKNCHFCGHEPKRFGTVACREPACGQRFCEHCLIKHMPHIEKAGPKPHNWKCPICRRLCCCLFDVCTRAHRHCKRYRRATWRKQENGGEACIAIHVSTETAVLNKAQHKVSVDDADVSLLLEFCRTSSPIESS